jgi:hypothetical protein
VRLAPEIGDAMFIKGDCLIGPHTFTFTVHGQRGEWKVTVIGPAGYSKSDETAERQWHSLFNEMLATAYENANRRRFLERRSEAVR